MSFLAPLFFIGAAAVALPIIFHLIRRTSREKTVFSSLLFLQPTPPRLTRKSRLENILLLVLRCAVLALLATAFARPLIKRPTAPEGGGGSAKRIVVLLDTSASMRRETLWPEARAKAEAVLKSTSPGDEVAVFTFDRRVNRLVTFEQWKAAAPNERVALAAQRLSAVAPGWAGTQFGNALISAAEALEEIKGEATRERQIIVVSDFQDGARLDGLQGHEWAKGTQVILSPVKARRVTNAGLQLLSEQSSGVDSNAAPKVRISNSSESKSEEFRVRWAGAASADSNTLSIYVPPGQNRIAPAPPAPNTTSEQIVLVGDDAEFDNSAFFVPPQQEQIRLLFVGNEEDKDPQGSLFYVKRAFAETQRQLLEVITRKPTEPIAGNELEKLNVAIIGGAISEEQARVFSEFVRGGKTVLFPMQSAADAQALAQITQQRVTAEEAPASGYAMLGEINFTHPLFAPFADPRFSDFTKIHFWKRRRVTVEPSANTRVVARFENGDPAVLQFVLGKGSVFAFASSWRPVDSQLALSSKFVPLLYSILEQSGAIQARPLNFTVGDEVNLANVKSTGALQIRKPDGSTTNLSAGETKFSQTELPGIYTITTAEPAFKFAVNLAAEESKTAPLAPEELQKLGVPLKQQATAASAKLAEQKRQQLQSAELEKRQKLWRWLIAVTLVVLLFETWIAGRTGRAIPATTSVV